MKGLYMNESLEQRILDKMVEVTFTNEDTFLVIKETLTRIGVASAKTKTLTQTAHILHKKGKYYIAHFKTLMELDGKTTNFDVEDESRLNTIATLLESWNLLKIVDKSKMKNHTYVKNIKVVKSSEKDDWILKSKHRLGAI